MVRKVLSIGTIVLAAVLGLTLSFGQSSFGQTTVAPTVAPTTSSVAPSPASTEFPVVLRQNVEAGKTPVGAQVQAKLVVATMIAGVVVPRDAVFSGEVVESVAKSGKDPSRLSIRMDNAQWKNTSAAVKVYLTSWFYPVEATKPQDLSYQPPDAANSTRNWNGMGTYPTPGNPVSQERFPSGDANKDTGLPSTSPSSSISKHRMQMKNVESIRNADGTVTLTSTHSNLKLDKSTTYVLASGDLLPRK
jgi:hypothetical protein